MTAQALGQQDHLWTLESRRLFHQWPLPERRRQFAEPAKLTANPPQTRRKTRSEPSGREATLRKNELTCRGEIWDVRFDPTVGAEIRKTSNGKSSRRTIR